jgi:hypothetical protein
MFLISCSDVEAPNKNAANNQKNQTNKVEESYRELIEIDAELDDFNNRYYAIAELDDKYFYLDENCKRISNKEYDFARDFSEGMAAVQIDGKWGFINPKQELVFPLTDYDDVGNFSDGLAWVMSEYKDVNKRYAVTERRYGYIDKSGKQVLNLNYAIASDFFEGVVYQKDFGNSNNHESSYYYMNKTGDKTSDGKKKPNDMLFSKYGTVVKKGSNKIPFKIGRGNRAKFGLKDSTGYTIIDPQFGYIGGFVNGIAPAQEYGRSLGEIGETGVGAWENGLWGFIDENGVWVIRPIYKNTSSHHCINKCFKVISDTNNVTERVIQDQYMDSLDTIKTMSQE